MHPAQVRSGGAQSRSPSSPWPDLLVCSACWRWSAADERPTSTWSSVNLPSSSRRTYRESPGFGLIFSRLAMTSPYPLEASRSRESSGDECLRGGFFEQGVRPAGLSECVGVAFLDDAEERLVLYCLGRLAEHLPVQRRAGCHPMQVA